MISRLILWLLGFRPRLAKVTVRYVPYIKSKHNEGFGWTYRSVEQLKDSCKWAFDDPEIEISVQEVTTINLYRWIEL